jgi:hypothetical protein
MPPLYNTSLPYAIVLIRSLLLRQDRAVAGQVLRGIFGHAGVGGGRGGEQE